MGKHDESERSVSDRILVATVMLAIVGTAAAMAPRTAALVIIVGAVALIPLYLLRVLCRGRAGSRQRPMKGFDRTG